MPPDKIQPKRSGGYSAVQRNSRGGAPWGLVLICAVTILALAAVFMFGYSIFGGDSKLTVHEKNSGTAAAPEDKTVPKHLVAYLQKIERVAQSKYVEPKDIQKAKDKVKICLRISRDGNPLGFVLMQSSEDLEIDKYIIKALLHQAYPAPTFKVDKNGVKTLFTIDGRKITVTPP
jgi:hypothetical protein